MEQAGRETASKNYGFGISALTERFQSLRNSQRNQTAAEQFYFAATHRSNGVLWPIFALARIFP
jgi:hypothetical protein